MAGRASASVSTPEGIPFYGGIHASLTTEGDASPDSALAVDRMPVAEDDGTLSYERTIEVSDEVANNVEDLHVVQHGIDINGNGEYDFEANGPSPLNEDVPFEATVPATCGEIELTRVGDIVVDRLGGRDRFETAVEISRRQFPDGADTVHLARSDVFADAVAGGSLTGGPLLLVPSCGDVPETVLMEIERLAPSEVLPLGEGTAICSDVVAAAAMAAQ